MATGDSHGPRFPACSSYPRPPPFNPPPPPNSRGQAGSRFWADVNPGSQLTSVPADSSNRCPGHPSSDGCHGLGGPLAPSSRPGPTRQAGDSDPRLSAHCSTSQVQGARPTRTPGPGCCHSRLLGCPNAKPALWPRPQVWLPGLGVAACPSARLAKADQTFGVTVRPQDDPCAPGSRLAGAWSPSAAPVSRATPAKPDTRPGLVPTRPGPMDQDTELALVLPSSWLAPVNAESRSLGRYNC
ncbi:basic proline-rich protein-like [Pteropus medius]|uniref:basic proline-rich protein-like n=1 Tax=Pteropus vampyrus TaxID=132908 RepID=UPI00196AF851|nr:basic proline-rich protein-like [Pteropus giganteus]